MIALFFHFVVAHGSVCRKTVQAAHVLVRKTTKERIQILQWRSDLDIIAVLSFLAISSYLSPRISLNPIDTHIRLVTSCTGRTTGAGVHLRSTIPRYAWVAGLSGYSSKKLTP